MPPLFAHDPLDAVQGAGRQGWLLAPATALSVACDHWVLALLALALCAWLERDVPSALKAYLPFAVALLAGVALEAATRRAGAMAGVGVRAVPSGHALWAATFAAYAARLYGARWGLPAAALALAGGIARIYLGSNGLPSVAAGWLIGGLLGVATFEVAARWAPRSPAGLRRSGQVQGHGPVSGRDVTP